MVAKFIKDGILKGELTIYGDGKQTRDFIHVNDICQGIYLVLNYKSSDQIWETFFHLGSDKGNFYFGVC